MVYWSGKLATGHRTARPQAAGPGLWYAQDGRARQGTGAWNGMRTLAIFALAFAGGTALYQYLLTPATLLWAGGASLVLAAAGLLLSGRRRRALLLLSCALAAGALRSALFDLAHPLPAQAWDGAVCTVRAEATDYASPVSGRLRLPVRLLDGPGCAALYYGGAELADLSPGDTFTVLADIRYAGASHGETIHTFTSRGIYLLLYPKGPMEVTPGDSPLRYLPRRLAKAIEGRLSAHNDPETAAFLTALLLGDRTGFTEERSTQLSEAGLTHITAVSGLHCGFIVTAAILLVGRHRRRLLAAAAIPALLFYMLLAGCSASVVRATVIQILCLSAPLLRRPPDPLTSLGAAMLLLLALDPMAVTNTGFQLSFASMFGILCLTPQLYRLLTCRWTGRLWRGLAGTVAASLGATLATAPFCGAYFGRVSLVGPASNVLTFLVVEGLFLWGLVSLPLLALLPAAGPLVAAPLALGTRWVLGVADALARLPFHAVYTASPYLPYWLVYTGCLFFYCVFASGGRRKYLLATVLSGCALVLLLRLPAQGTRGARLHAAAVDVGQGACTVLASQGQTALVDCGSSNSFLSAGTVAADTLAIYGYGHLDALVLTHYHADHANGLEVLLSRTRVDRMFLPLLEEDGEDLYRQVLALAERYGAEVVYILGPERIPLGAAELTLYPPLGTSGANEQGLTILCTLEDFDLLITGDMDSATERRLAETYPLPDIEVLLAGHHGSANSSSYDLLERVTPEVGVISTGTNSYGHPSPEAMERMASMGMELYRTDWQGTVSILVK